MGRRENQSRVVESFILGGIRNILDLVKEKAKEDSSKEKSGRVRLETESRDKNEKRNEKEIFKNRRKWMSLGGGWSRVSCQRSFYIWMLCSLLIKCYKRSIILV